jgi:hypothetical protein
MIPDMSRATSVSMGLIPLGWAVGLFSWSACGDSGGKGATAADTGADAAGDTRGPMGSGGSGGGGGPGLDGNSGGRDGGGVGGAGDGPGADLRADAPPNDAMGNVPEVPAGTRPRAMVWVRESNGPNFARAIGGTGKDDVWTVSDFGEVRHTTGNGTWTYRTVDLVLGGRLTGVWGAGPNNVFASAFANVMVRWDGSGKWQRFGFPAGELFEDVWGTGPNDVYAGGKSVYHFDGASWTLMPDLTSAFSIWGTGPNDIWMLNGTGFVTHKTADGRWVKEQTGLIAPGVAIWNSGPADAYALSAAELVHSTGDGRWIMQALEGRGPSENLTALWGSGPTDVYIGSADGQLFRSTGDGRWYAEKLNASMPGCRVYGIWGTGSDDVWVVSGCGTYRGHSAP